MYNVNEKLIGSLQKHEKHLLLVISVKEGVLIMKSEMDC